MRVPSKTSPSPSKGEGGEGVTLGFLRAGTSVVGKQVRFQESRSD